MPAWAGTERIFRKASSAGRRHSRAIEVGTGMIEIENENYTIIIVRPTTGGPTSLNAAKGLNERRRSTLVVHPPHGPPPSKGVVAPWWLGEKPPPLVTWLTLLQGTDA